MQYKLPPLKDPSITAFESVKQTYACLPEMNVPPLFHAYTFPQRRDSYSRFEHISDHGSTTDHSDDEAAPGLSSLCGSICQSPTQSPTGFSPTNGLLPAPRSPNFLAPIPYGRANSAPIPLSPNKLTPSPRPSKQPKRMGNNTFGRSGKLRCRQCRQRRQKVLPSCSHCVSDLLK